MVGGGGATLRLLLLLVLHTSAETHQLRELPPHLLTPIPFSLLSRAQQSLGCDWFKGGPPARSLVTTSCDLAATAGT